MKRRPHLLGIDDGPFVKGRDATVPLIAVAMSGADLIEGVALERFPLDGAGATDFVAEWVRRLRTFEALHAVALGGITIAGLGVIDVCELSERLALPVLVVTRKNPSASELARALRAAGLEARLPIVERSPAAVRCEEGIYLAFAGTDFDGALALLRATQARSHYPEPVRVAHLIGQAVVFGASRGRV